MKLRPHALLLTVFTFIASSTFASDKGYIGIKGGVAFPTGDFALSDTANSSSGYGNTGYIIDISAGYKLIGPLGIAGMINYGTNNFEDLGSVDFNFNGLTTGFSISGTEWKYYSFMIGPYASFALSDAFSLDLRLLLGSANVSSPEIRSTFSFLGSTLSTVQPSSDSKALAILFGGGLRFNLSERLNLLTAFELYGSDPEFKFTDLTTGNVNIEKYNISTANVSVGLGFRF